MAKYLQIVKLLESRIRHGDYLLKEIPAERELASEVGVSQITARKAFLELVNKGMLVRKPNGRLQINRDKENGAKPLQLAFLSPNFTSRHVENWRVAIEEAQVRFKAILRPVLFIHWDDPVIMDVLDGFDGIFLVSNNQPIPEGLMRRFQERRPPVVCLDSDLSGQGVPSMTLFPSVFVQALLDHLAGLGHRRIDCLNIQPLDAIIEERITQWNLWRAAHGMEGELVSEPMGPQGSKPLEAGYRLMQRWLATRRGKADAIVCTSAPCAMGGLRALHEAGVKAGQEVSICAVDGEGFSRFQVPSLTALEVPDASPYISVCLEWMSRGGRDWIGPLWVQPSKPVLFIGESTGRVVR